MIKKATVILAVVGASALAVFSMTGPVQAKDFDVPIAKVVQHCHSNLPDNLWQAIADQFYWHAQQMP